MSSAEDASSCRDETDSPERTCTRDGQWDWMSTWWRGQPLAAWARVTFAAAGGGPGPRVGTRGWDALVHTVATLMLARDAQPTWPAGELTRVAYRAWGSSEYVWTGTPPTRWTDLDPARQTSFETLVREFSAAVNMLEAGEECKDAEWDASVTALAVRHGRQ